MRDFDNSHYILDENRQPLKVDLETWARWFSDENKRVALDETRYYRLSSVFLGIDHNFTDRGPPLLFETMLFERKPTVGLIFGRLRQYNEEAFHDQEQTCWRWASWDDTVANHNTILRRLQKQEAEALQLIAKHKLHTS